MRYTKAEKIKDLVDSLNRQRAKRGKPLVSRRWTGAGHWLKTEESNYHSIGPIFTKDDEFIGFLEGLIYAREKGSLS